MVIASVHHRDALLRIAGQDAETSADLMRQAANLLRGRARAELLAMSAMCYYCAGDGGSAGMALDASKRIDAGQSGLGALERFYELQGRRLRTRKGFVTSGSFVVGVVGEGRCPH